MKLAVIIGHSSNAQGARAYNGMTEWAWNMDLYYKHLWSKLSLITDAYEVFWRDNLPYKKAIDEMVKEEIVPFGPDLCIELHFNAYDGKTPVERAEALWLMNESGRFADIWVNEMKRYYDPDSITDRALTAHQRGSYNLQSLFEEEIPNVILEPCFGDTQNDLSVSVLEDPERYATLLAKCLAKYQGMDL